MNLLCSGSDRVDAAFASGLQWPWSGTAKQVMARRLFEPTLDLWGAKFIRPVCMACPDPAHRVTRSAEILLA
jgi:hypothetical protein